MKCLKTYEFSPDDYSCQKITMNFIEKTTDYCVVKDSTNNL